MGSSRRPHAPLRSTVALRCSAVMPPFPPQRGAARGTGHAENARVQTHFLVDCFMHPHPRPSSISLTTTRFGYVRHLSRGIFAPTPEICHPGHRLIRSCICADPCRTKLFLSLQRATPELECSRSSLLAFASSAPATSRSRSVHSKRALVWLWRVLAAFVILPSPTN
ncbi:hypothetical protein GQ53DRAFT_154029 [Thozetella sp. PMI_491]|nr:hypothetical protein GQ53DRAFT_154029 [Thozetella sp. PMI_491]